MNAQRLHLARWLRPIPWPLPALLAWTLAWLVFVGLTRTGLGGAPAFAAALLATLPPTLLATHWWRRVIVLAGFPLSLLALGTAQAVPAWAWPLVALPGLVAYPLGAWKDAPFFPTPGQALDGLRDHVRLPPTAALLDAGCGMGHGLAALQRLWPQARLHGIEWSRPLAWLARRRVPAADIACGDMWSPSWSGYELVYVFQRPESMARAWTKACSEMASGRWFVSLEFEVPGVPPTARLQGPGQRPVWIYRIPARGAAKR